MWDIGGRRKSEIEKESKQKEREREEESEGCSSVSALWSRASWDSRTLCQDSMLQNQSLSTEHKEKKKRCTHIARMCTLTHANKHTFTQHVTGNVSRPCPAPTRQPQHVTVGCDCGPL